VGIGMRKSLWTSSWQCLDAGLRPFFLYFIQYTKRLTPWLGFKSGNVKFLLKEILVGGHLQHPCWQYLDAELRTFVYFIQRSKLQLDFICLPSNHFRKESLLVRSYSGPYVKFNDL
jgi:hypothetical protein